MSTLDKIIAAITPPESDKQRAEARAKAKAAATPGDWLSLILKHHEQVETAFSEAREASTTGAREAALKRLGEVLTAHSIAEEAVIYPALADIGRKGPADMAYAEQVAAKMQMAALEKLDPLSEDYVDKLGHLQGAVAHHVFKEEGDWFVDLKGLASPADQEQMLKRYTQEFERYMRGGMKSTKSAEPKSFRPSADA